MRQDATEQDILDAGRPLHLALISCHLLWREFNLLTARSIHHYLPVYLRQGLHDEPDRLQEQLQAEIDRQDGRHDAILIGYGLCSNGISGLHTRHSRLIFMRGHDCVTFLLGSRQTYQEYFDANPGTYWYSSGWIETGKMPGSERQQELYRQYCEQYDEETADYLIGEELRWMAKYQKACYICQPGLTARTEEEREFTRSCAQFCGWQYAEQQGDWQLLQDFISGPWTDDRFLVVEPGQVVRPSFDQMIIRAGPD